MEETAKHPDDEAQEDLVREFCQEAEALIGSAPDYPSAVQLRDSLCQRFQMKCKSGLVVHATKEYMTQIIQRRWRAGAGGADRTNNEH